MRFYHLILTLIFCLFFSANSALADKKFRVELPKNTKAPDFTLKSNNNKNIKLSDLRGQVVFVNFWASWCPPCRQEMPELDKLYTRYKDYGATILGINSDDKVETAVKHLKGSPVAYPVLWDTDKKINKLYNVKSQPESVLVDCDGNARFQYYTYKPGKEKIFKKDIKKLLAECSM